MRCSHSKISRFPNCGGCMGSKTGAGCLRAFCGSRPSTDLCAVHKEQCRDRRTLRSSNGYMRFAIVHAVRRGYGCAWPADRAATAGAVLGNHAPRSTQIDADLHKLRAKALTKSTLAFRRELHRTCCWQSASPTLLHAVLANQRADHAGQMRSALAPIEAGAAEHAPARRR